MRSMTGYGEKLVEREGEEVFIQIKTLNHRFLEIDISPSQEIPWEWERKIEDKIREKISRGKVLINLRINRKGGKAFRIEPNFELAVAYLKALKELSTQLNLEEKIDLSLLLSVPEMVKIEEEEKIGVESMIEEGVDEALEQVVELREKEGKKHLENILQCVEKIKISLNSIEAEIPLLQKKYRKKIREELGKILPEAGSSFFLNQISLMLTKGNIEEEITRFHSHLLQLNQTLQQQGPMGKKLGFILQELHREINTIGAKSLSYPVSEQVIQIKDNLEKIREQIYNIE